MGTDNLTLRDEMTNCLCFIKRIMTKHMNFFRCLHSSSFKLEVKGIRSFRLSDTETIYCGHKSVRDKEF